MLIESAPSYQAQCTLPTHPIYQILLFDFSRVWFRASPKFSYKECGSIVWPGLATGLIGVILHTPYPSRPFFVVLTTAIVGCSTSSTLFVL